MKIPTILVSLALLGLSLSSSAYGQSTPVSKCDGVINIVRLSEITPTGSMDKFDAAVAAHQAWYKSHGFSDIIFASRVVLIDPKSHAENYSDTQMLTYHYSKPGGGPPTTHDAAWDAYVKMYNDTSKIKETYMHCVPSKYAPASLK